MYCSACGVAVAQGLTYCNYCGAKLNRGDHGAKSPDVRPESLIFGMLAVFVFGIAAITLLMGMMKSVLGLPVERVLAFTLLPFLVILVLEGVFIRLLLRRNRGVEETRYRKPSKEQVTNELDESDARALPEPMPSVTEHTTRAFAPIHNERTSK
ncbi:MAG: hypothetical protein H0U60_07440 [Blastocatellia bacterium]|nr:hypothetical protein [Blastocatellia bacterium]